MINNSGADNPSYTVEAVDRAIKILDCIGRGINNLTDIASSCKLSNSTTHRLLHTLAESKAVVFDPVSHRYFLGYSLIKLTTDFKITHQHLILQADAEMRRLGEQTGETVSLLVLEGLLHYRLLTVPSRHWLRIVDEDQEGRNIGEMYFGAPGKVLLSQLSEETLKKTFKHMKSSTGNAQLTLRDLKEIIEPVKKQGYAITSGERVPGATCLSIPIKNYPFPLSLNIHGPSIRLKPKLKDYLKQASQSADRISENIKAVL